jgi:Ca2+:H+ antiporter
VAADRLAWGDLAVFITSAIAILPVAIWLSTATEELSLSLGPSVGALLNAVFSNATELIIAVVALRAGLVDIVKASSRLALGLSMLAGGVGRREQAFQPVVARVNGSAMTLALLAILIPSASVLSAGRTAASTQGFSTFVAWVLLLVYGLTLLFSLRTHCSLYEVAEADLAEQTEAHPGQRPAALPWLLVLLAATAALAYESELFVGVVETVTEGFGLSALFTCEVLLPLLGGTAEYITDVSLARKDKMGLAISVVLGSTLLVVRCWC